jgi:hypothetical protein
MKIYMLQDVVTLLFYRRKAFSRWVKQEDASVWTSKQGPAAVQQRFKPGWTTEIKAFNLVEIPCTKN